MALFEKVQQGDTWRLRDLRDGQYVARFRNEAHIDRFIRDSTLAQAIHAIIQGTGSRAEKRAAAVDAYQAWVAEGGRVVNLSDAAGGLALSDTNTDVLPGETPVVDGNRHLAVGGAYAAAVHGTVFNVLRPLRYVRLAERLWAARQLSGTTARNQATDAALDEFAADGGLE